MEGKLISKILKKMKSKNSTYIIVIIVVVMVIAAVAIGICCGRIKAKAAQSQIPPYLVYGNPQSIHNNLIWQYHMEGNQ